MTHFDEMTCLLYLEGQLERARALELAAHAEVCADCRALLRVLERESQLLEQALVEEDETVPARLLAPPTREALPWSGILAFGFTVAAAYTFWTSIVEPWRQQFSQAGFGGSNLLTMLFFGGVLWKGWGAMLNTLEYGAMMTLGILALGLLRRRWHRWTTVAVVMGAAAAALTLPPAASAAEYHAHSSFYTLASGEVVRNDLIVTAETARIDGTVEGDLIFFGRSLTINGHVTGDVLGFGQSVRVNGPVDGNVRVCSSMLLLGGPVAKNVTSFGQTVEFDARSQAGGSMMLFGGAATLDGRIGGDLTAYVGRNVLNGVVGGNAQLRAGHLTIGPTAEIAGKASYRGQHPPDVSPQAKLASPLEVHIVHRRPDYASPRFYLRQFLHWCAAFLFGLLIVFLMPGFFSDVVRSTERAGISFGLGLIVLVAGFFFVIFSILLALIGLPVGVVILFFYVPAIYAAQVFVGAFLGGKLLGPTASSGDALGRLALGLLVIRVLGMIPILRVFVWIAVILWGVGALTLALYDRSRTRPAPLAAGQAIG